MWCGTPLQGVVADVVWNPPAGRGGGCGVEPPCRAWCRMWCGTPLQGVVADVVWNPPAGRAGGCGVEPPCRAWWRMWCGTPLQGVVADGAGGLGADLQLKCKRPSRYRFGKEGAQTPRLDSACCDIARFI